MSSVHEHFIKKVASSTVASIRHRLLIANLKRRTDSVRRRSVGDVSLSNNYCLNDEPQISALRFEHCILDGKKTKIHRVFVQCSDSGSTARVGWVVNDDCNICMVCNAVKFNGFLHGKHHCRACGNIVCASCSSRTVNVADLNCSEPVRVCSQCYYGQVSALTKSALGNVTIVNDLFAGSCVSSVQRHVGRILWANPSW